MTAREWDALFELWCRTATPETLAEWRERCPGIQYEEIGGALYRVVR